MGFDTFQLIMLQYSFCCSHYLFLFEDAFSFFMFCCCDHSCPSPYSFSFCLPFVTSDTSYFSMRRSQLCLHYEVPFCPRRIASAICNAVFVFSLFGLSMFQVLFLFLMRCGPIYVFLVLLIWSRSLACVWLRFLAKQIIVLTDLLPDEYVFGFL